MGKSTADDHYEEKFEFPLWKLIQQRAEEKDISYVQASVEVLPEYEKGIRYRDEEYERTEVEKRQKELAALSQKSQ